MTTAGEEAGVAGRAHQAGRGHHVRHHRGPQRQPREHLRVLRLQGRDAEGTTNNSHSPASPTGTACSMSHTFTSALPCVERDAAGVQHLQVQVPGAEFPGTATYLLTISSSRE
jgi:hypothetical protein